MASFQFETSCTCFTRGSDPCTRCRPLVVSVPPTSFCILPTIVAATTPSAAAPTTYATDEDTADDGEPLCNVVSTTGSEEMALRARATINGRWRRQNMLNGRGNNDIR